MKKILSILIASLLVLTIFTGCSKALKEGEVTGTVVKSSDSEITIVVGDGSTYDITIGADCVTDAPDGIYPSDEVEIKYKGDLSSQPSAETIKVVSEAKATEKETSGTIEAYSKDASIKIKDVHGEVFDFTLTADVVINGNVAVNNVAKVKYSERGDLITVSEIDVTNDQANAHHAVTGVVIKNTDKEIEIAVSKYKDYFVIDSNTKITGKIQNGATVVVGWKGAYASAKTVATTIEVKKSPQKASPTTPTSSSNPFTGTWKGDDGSTMTFKDGKITVSVDGTTKVDNVQYKYADSKLIYSVGAGVVVTFNYSFSNDNKTLTLSASQGSVTYQKQ